MQLVFLSKPARSFMGNKDQVGVFHLKGWLKVKSGGRYQEGRGMYKSSATRSVDETTEAVDVSHESHTEPMPQVLELRADG